MCWGGLGPGKRPELGRCPPSPVAAALLTTFLPAPAVRSWGTCPRQCLGRKKKGKRERERETEREDRELALEVLRGSL